MSSHYFTSLIMHHCKILCKINGIESHLKQPSALGRLSDYYVTGHGFFFVNYLKFQVIIKYSVFFKSRVTCNRLLQLVDYLTPFEYLFRCHLLGVRRRRNKMAGKPDRRVGSEDKTLCQQYLYIAFVVACYWVVSIAIVFVNKSLLSARQDFDAPMFVTWFQCVFTYCVCLFFRRFRNIFTWFPDIQFSYATMKRTLPLSIVFVAMVTFNNLCLKYVGVAFYYLARSLTTVTNVAFTFIILRKSVSARAIGCCLIITMGYFAGIDQEGLSGGITTKGIIFGVLSSCCVSLNSIYTKKTLPIVDDSVWTLNYYNNLNASLMFIPLMFIFGELPQTVFVTQMSEIDFWMLMCLGGVMGVLIGFVTGLQIKATSPLTHNISGTAKACAQTVIAVWVYPEVKSWAWWASNWTVLFGSAAYTKVQQMDMEKEFNKNVLPSKVEKAKDESSEKLLDSDSS